jgi:uncharacterized peroxidase-related enzyme
VHHGAGLKALLEQAGRPADEARTLVEMLGRDWHQASLEAADRVLLEYAYRLTAQPGRTGAVDVQRLRDAGFDDRGIHDICAIAAYYAFVNRIADGLAVQLEPRFRGT